jgi:MFS family permease
VFTGGVIVTQDFLDALGLNGNTSMVGAVTALYDISCFIGAILAIMIGDLLGRKKTILIGTSIMTIGAILQISTFSVPVMIVARIIAGIGNGINASTTPKDTNTRDKSPLLESHFSFYTIYSSVLDGEACLVIPY